MVDFLLVVMGLMISWLILDTFHVDVIKEIKPLSDCVAYCQNTEMSVFIKITFLFSGTRPPTFSCTHKHPPKFEVEFNEG